MWEEDKRRDEEELERVNFTLKMNKEDIAKKLANLRITGITFEGRVGKSKRLGEKNALRIISFLLKRIEEELNQGREVKLRGIGTISRDGIKNETSKK